MRLERDLTPDIEPVSEQIKDVIFFFMGKEVRRVTGGSSNEVLNKKGREVLHSLYAAHGEVTITYVIGNVTTGTVTFGG